MKLALSQLVHAFICTQDVRKNAIPGHAGALEVVLYPRTPRCHGWRLAWRIGGWSGQKDSTNLQCWRKMESRAVSIKVMICGWHDHMYSTNT